MRSEIDFSYGLFSRFPGTPWFGGLIGKSRFGELTAVGLTNVDGGHGRIILNSSALIEIEIYSCKQRMASDIKATWECYDPVARSCWQRAGAKGEADAEFICDGMISPGENLEICIADIPTVLLVRMKRGSVGLTDIFGWIEV